MDRARDLADAAPKDNEGLLRQKRRPAREDATGVRRTDVARERVVESLTRVIRHELVELQGFGIRPERPGGPELIAPSSWAPEQAMENAANPRAMRR